MNTRTNSRKKCHHTWYLAHTLSYGKAGKIKQMRRTKPLAHRCQLHVGKGMVERLHNPCELSLSACSCNVGGHRNGVARKNKVPSSSSDPRHQSQPTRVAVVPGGRPPYAGYMLLLLLLLLLFLHYFIATMPSVGNRNQGDNMVLTRKRQDETNRRPNRNRAREGKKEKQKK